MSCLLCFVDVIQADRRENESVVSPGVDPAHYMSNLPLKMCPMFSVIGITSDFLIGLKANSTRDNSCLVLYAWSIAGGWGNHRQ